MADGDAERDEAPEDHGAVARRELVRVFARPGRLVARERAPLREEHEALLVVRAAVAARRGDQAHAVVGPSRIVARGAEEDVGAEPRGDGADLGRDHRILLEEARDRILRPHDEGRMRGRREAGGRLHVGHHLAVGVRARPFARGRHVRLHHGHAVRREPSGRAARDDDRAGDPERDDGGNGHRERREGATGAPFTHEHDRIRCDGRREREDERHAVDARQRGDLDEGALGVLAVPEECPRLAENPPAEELGRDPERRHEEPAAHRPDPEQDRRARREEPERHTPEEERVDGPEKERGNEPRREEARERRDEPGYADGERAGIAVDRAVPERPPRRPSADDENERRDRDPAARGEVEGRKGEPVEDRAGEQGEDGAHVSGRANRGRYFSGLVGAAAESITSSNGGVAPGRGPVPSASVPEIATTILL